MNPYLSESIKPPEQKFRTKKKHGGTDLEKNKLKKHRWREGKLKENVAVTIRVPAAI